ncbi:MAG: energy transducer TonB [Burkholderiales bacterium]
MTLHALVGWAVMTHDVHPSRDTLPSLAAATSRPLVARTVAFPAAGGPRSVAPDIGSTSITDHTDEAQMAQGGAALRSPGADEANAVRPGAEEAYLPRQALDRSPAALAPVLLAYPEGAPPGRYQARLTVFIDETGEVRRIRIDQGQLPAALASAATQAFMATRFSPGERQQRAVKARLSIEVEFAADADPQDHSL